MQRSDADEAITSVDELAGAVRGAVLTPEAEGFATAVPGHNPAVAHSPDLVVRAADADDVAATIAYARRHGLTVQAQSSGHGPARLVRGGVLLLTRALDGIEVDAEARTVRVGAGATWGELVTACGAHGLAPLGMASVASVGVAGYLLGGGMGPLGRRDGFGADHVVGLDVIDVDGHPRHVDEQHDPELFWALRGGRLAPVIVTAFELRLEPAPEIFTATVKYDRADAAGGLAAYAAWQRELPESTGSVATLFRFPDLPVLPEEIRGQRFLQIDVLGTDVPAGRAALERLVAAAAPAAVDERVTDPAGWMQAQPPVPSSPTWNRGAMLRSLEPDVVAAVVAGAGLESDAPWNIVELRPLGGALSRPPRVPNAVGGRSDGVVLGLVAAAPNGPGELPAQHDELLAGLARWVVPGINVNFYGLAGPTRPLRDSWPPETYERLRALAAERDPEGVFPRVDGD